MCGSLIELKIQDSLNSLSQIYYKILFYYYFFLNSFSFIRGTACVKKKLFHYSAVSSVLTLFFFFFMRRCELTFLSLLFCFGEDTLLRAKSCTISSPALPFWYKNANTGLLLYSLYTTGAYLLGPEIMRGPRLEYRAVARGCIYEIKTRAAHKTPTARRPRPRAANADSAVPSSRDRHLLLFRFQDRTEEPKAGQRFHRNEHGARKAHH